MSSDGSAQSGGLQSHVLRGTAVSSGIGRGTAHVLACADRVAAAQREVSAAEVERELERLSTALRRAEAELVALKQSVSEKIGSNEAEIFAAQALLVSDSAFQGQVSALIRDRRVNVEAALAEIIDKFSHAFDAIPDPYLRERASDIRDIGRRVLSALLEEHSELLDIPEGAIVVADELLPSLTARLELGHVRGFVTARGGKFSHTSILARSQGMPAIAGVAEVAREIKTGDHLVLDGFAGAVFVNPPRSVEAEYERVEDEIRAHKDKLRELVDLPSCTLDGTKIGLFANVSKFADTEAALLYNADGIGLYRTEFGYTIRKAFPTEAEQYEYLKRAAERFHPRRVVLRLLDVGGDKTLPYFPLPSPKNPALGQRGVRLLLHHPDLLKRQLRAFLRISAEHPVSVLLPVVGGIDEVRETKQIVREVMQEMSRDGLAYNPEVPVGAMIEVPSAALIARKLADEVDFFSLGTNDLVQYLLAADREDENIASRYQPLHPAVLALIHSVAQAAAERGRELTLCGDMAGEPLYTELLLGLGLREFSVAPGEMLDVKDRIRSATVGRARSLAEEALGLSSAREVQALLERTRETASGPRA